MNKIDVMYKIRLLVCAMAILLVVGCNSNQPTAPNSTTHSQDTENTETEGFGSVSENQLLAIQNNGHPDAIAGEYLIIFENRTRSGNKMSAINSAQTQITGDGGKIQREFLTFGGFSAKLSPATLESLRANPNVKTIEANLVVTADDWQDNPPNWGLDRIDHPQLPMDNKYEYAGDGSGVTAYILDTGIHASHSEFSGRVVGGYTTVNDGYGWGDCAGHGTHVAGTVAGQTVGVAPNANIVSVRVLDCNNNGTLDGILAGLEWLRLNTVQPAVINMSLSLGGVSNTFDNVVRTIANSGVVIANSAGNGYGSDACNYSPQPVAEVITVGSTDRYDQLSEFSNLGTCVDIFAPGGDIYSSSKSGDTQYKTMSGTSMATPHVTGCAARYLSEFPSATSQDVINALTGEVVSENVVSGNLQGAPNRLLHCNFSEIHDRINAAGPDDSPTEPVPTEPIPTEPAPTEPAPSTVSEPTVDTYFIQNVRFGQYLEDVNGNAKISFAPATWKMNVMGSTGSDDIVTFQHSITGNYLSYQNREARTSSNIDTTEQWILKSLGNNTYHIASVLDSVRNLDGDGIPSGYDVDTSKSTNADKQWRIISSGADAIGADSLVTVSGDNFEMYGEENDGDEEEDMLPTAVTLHNQEVSTAVSLLMIFTVFPIAIITHRILR